MAIRLTRSMSGRKGLSPGLKERSQKGSKLSQDAAARRFIYFIDGFKPKALAAAMALIKRPK